jgi:hypothetical protein
VDYCECNKAINERYLQTSMFVNITNKQNDSISISNPKNSMLINFEAYCILILKHMPFQKPTIEFMA